MLRHNKDSNRAISRRATESWNRGSVATYTLTRSNPTYSVQVYTGTVSLIIFLLLAYFPMEEKRNLQSIVANVKNDRSMSIRFHIHMFINYEII